MCLLPRVVRVKTFERSLFGSAAISSADSAIVNSVFSPYSSFSLCSKMSLLKSVFIVELNLLRLSSQPSSCL